MNSNNINKSAMDLIYLVSCAVNNEKPEKTVCDQMDLAEVYKTSIKHSLTEAAAYSLEQVISLTEDFKEEKYKAIRRLSLLNIEREKILNELEKHKIWYLPLKGIVLKDFYPKTAMRQMSDNDILCDSEKAEEIKAVMESLGYVCRHYGKNHHDVYEKPPQLDFEMHRSLFDRMNSPEFYEYFRNIKEKLIEDSGNKYRYRMSNEDLYIYNICHLRNHYHHRGAGLRSLLDIYVFCNKLGSVLDYDYLRDEFQKLDLVDFEQGTRALALKVFTRRELSDKELSELDFYIESGAHGSFDNMIMYNLKNDDSARAKRKYAMNRLFPPKDSLQRNHPIVYRHMALYPFWLISRPVKGLIKHRKKMLGEIKRLKSFKKKENRGNYN